MKLLKLSPVARAIGVISAVAMLVGGVTFAALNDTATLTDNSVSTASANADLLLWDGDSFEPEAPGFTLADLMPGEESEKFKFYFKNNGNVPLDLTVRTDALPTLSAGLDPEDVTLKFYGACGDTLSVNLQELFDDPQDVMPCNPLEEGAQGVVGEDETNEANFAVTVKVDESVPLGEDPETVGNFDLIFDGAAVLSEE